MNKIVLIICSIALCIDFACIETEPVSPEPEITFESLEGFLGYDSLGNLKTIGKLVFSFVDGDADIGMYRESIIYDSTGWDERNYNVFLFPYVKIDTNYFFLEPDSSLPPPYFTIWHHDNLDRVGQNKTVKGTITITLEDLPPYDTVRFDFFIRDRAGHDSNIEATTDLSKIK